MKKLFKKPEMEIVSLDSIYDVITASLDGGDMTPEPGTDTPDGDLTNV